MFFENHIIKQTYLLQKFPGKGGWTYAEIPEIAQNKDNPFGWVKVKGSIDGIAFKNYKLMPMGNGRLFLPVKKELRKIIGKEAGDTVEVCLYLDNDPLEIPEELLQCLKDEPMVYERFLTYKEGQKKEFIDWIFSAKTLKTKTERILITIDKISKGETYRNSNDKMY